MKMFHVSGGRTEEIHVLERDIVDNHMLKTRIEVYDKYDEAWVEKLVPSSQVVSEAQLSS